MSQDVSNPDDIDKIVAAFTPIYLEEMNGVSLMDRVDTKFIFNRNELSKILINGFGDYKILEIDGLRIMGYKNQYFDTKNKQFYIDHHNGKKGRTKVRVREYINSGLSFLEVKRKNNKGRTRKTRIRIPEFQTKLSKENLGFVNNLVPKQEELFPILQNSFNRITLVNQHTLERVTFDTDLYFDNHQNTMAFNQLVIAEVKQASFNRSTPIFELLRANRITPYRISKYCIGATSLYNDLKGNAFKEKLLRINKITAA